MKKLFLSICLMLFASTSLFAEYPLKPLYDTIDSGVRNLKPGDSIVKSNINWNRHYDSSYFISDIRCRVYDNRYFKMKLLHSKVKKDFYIDGFTGTTLEFHYNHDPEFNIILKSKYTAGEVDTIYITGTFSYDSIAYKDSVFKLTKDSIWTKTAKYDPKNPDTSECYFYKFRDSITVYYMYKYDTLYKDKDTTVIKTDTILHYDTIRIITRYYSKKVPYNKLVGIVIGKWNKSFDMDYPLLYLKFDITSVNDSENDKTIFYPNPADKFIKVNKDSPQKVWLYNLNGSIIKEQNDNLIDVSCVPDGLYFLKIGDEVHKVLIQH